MEIGSLSALAFRHFYLDAILGIADCGFGIAD